MVIGDTEYTGSLVLGICVSQQSEILGKSNIVVEGKKVEPHIIAAAIEALDALRESLIEQLITASIQQLGAEEADEQCEMCEAEAKEDLLSEKYAGQQPKDQDIPQH